MLVRRGGGDGQQVLTGGGRGDIQKEVMLGRCGGLLLQQVLFRRSGGSLQQMLMRSRRSLLLKQMLLGRCMRP